LTHDAIEKGKPGKPDPYVEDRRETPPSILFLRGEKPDISIWTKCNTFRTRRTVKMRIERFGDHGTKTSSPHPKDRMKGSNSK